MKRTDKNIASYCLLNKPIPQPAQTGCFAFRSVAFQQSFFLYYIPNLKEM